MDLPILNQLEKIYPSQDRGYEAIRKLVKNQNLIEQGIKEIDGINNLDEIREQINVLNELFVSGGIDLEPYLVNGWTRNAFFTIKAYKIGKFVFVSGALNVGVLSGGTAVFTNLPEELRNNWRSPLQLGDGCSLIMYPDGSAYIPETFATSKTTLYFSSYYRLDA